MPPTPTAVRLTVTGPAAFAGAFVDALQRHGVEVFEFEAPPAARSLDVEQIVTVPLVVALDDDGIEAAVRDFLEEFPEGIVREPDVGLG
jgi:hypothetical protein